MIISGVILLLGLGAFFMFNGSTIDTGSISALSEDTSQQISLSQQIERELLNELLQLREIRLDDNIFTNDTFVSLVDFSRPIQAQPIGRDNPFAPIENVPGVTPRASATNESTEGGVTVSTGEQE